MRLDQYVVEKGYFKTRSKALEAIKQKQVLVDGIPQKPSFQIKGNVEITLLNVNKYVSRAALKLKKAIEEFKIDFSGKVVLDVGASTGGFTEVALEYGAKTVYAVDVGTSQLDEILQLNEKVISYEQTNILKVTESYFTKGNPDVIVMDVSFVSIKQIIPYIKQFTTEMVVLIKPQFESGGKHLYKGIIRDKNVRKHIVDDVLSFLKEEGLNIIGVVESPIKGKEGNIEYITYMK